jgi:Flp pilus assembly protein TadG
MHTKRSRVSNEQGFALIYMCVVLAVLLIFTGLAVDSGRAYVVKAQLTKAVDGAALAAARNLNSGDPRAEAAKIFKANFPAGYLGTTSSTDPTADPGFFSSSVNPTTGVNTVVVSAEATLPTTFMKLANFNEVKVSSVGEAQRRMVDLSLVLDVSSSIGSKWTTVADAVRVFIDSFDKNNDRMSLLTFGNGVSVLDAMPSGRGFDKAKLISDVPVTLPGGSTNMVEGLYRGWDELRSVPTTQQSGLRVIVIFTDGASNSVPANYDLTPGQGRALRTFDFPKIAGETAGQTHDDPSITGLYPTIGAASNPTTGTDVNVTPSNWNNTCAVAGSCPTTAQVPALPLTSYHANHRSSSIPTGFPLQVNYLTVEGTAQSTARPLRNKFTSGTMNGRYPPEVFNINNAARNLIEIIADAARADAGGDYKVRIYTIGMGELVRFKLGTRKEMSEDILKRIANDDDGGNNKDWNKNQLTGKYYFAATAADVGPAFQALQNQIVRLSK